MELSTQIAPAKEAVELPDIWKRWRVRIRMRDKLIGSMPKNPGDLERFVSTVSPTEKDVAELSEKLNDEVPVDELADLGASTFKKNDGGLYIEDRQIKAAYKEAAKILGYTLAKSKASPGPGRQFFQHAFFVDPPVLQLGKDEPDGTERMFGNVMTAQGPRSIVRNMDYVVGVEIEWTAKAVVRKSSCPLSDDQFATMLAMMQENGIGASRSQGYGKFDVIEVETL